MVLTYGKYIGLMSALDEHCNGALGKDELQNAIFDHYAGLYGSFVAENINGVKRLFLIRFQKTKNNKAERKLFRHFMNEELNNKRKKKNKLCQK